MKYIISYTFFFISLFSFTQVEQLKKNDENLKKKLDKEFQKSLTTYKNLDLTTYVNPFIGTGGHGHTFPGASAPFGMIQLSPDTRYQGWDACSGYHYSDSTIFGFSHTHLSGTGVEDLCDLLLVPQTGKANPNPQYIDKNGYINYFSHSKEKASPGYYEVELKNPRIKVKLTVSERAGFHEYLFLDSNIHKIILIDLEHKDRLLSSELKIVNAKEIQGNRISNSWAKKQHFYFYLMCNEEFKTSFYGKNKLALIFPKHVQTVQIKVGISAVDEIGAKSNLISEIPDFDFEKRKNLTKELWNKELHKIEVNGKDEEAKTIFYSALYHSFLCPIQFSDVDGRYRGNDEKIYQDISKRRYSIFSIWDTYRSTHPLFNLIQTKRSADFIQTLLDIYKETNDLPVWELWGNETECMIGYHSSSLILDAYRKHIPIKNPSFALEAMVKTSKDNNYGKNFYRKNGFIDSNKEAESVSKTLEYTYDDWCISQFAKDIKRNDVFREYRSSSYSFVNLLHPKSHFMQARNGALWTSNFRPSEVNFNFTEANSWQYSLATPHALSSHIQLLGGKDSLEAFLDRLFSARQDLEGRQQADITGLIGQYAHGNEPSHHVAYLYNYTNSPYKTQEKIHQIMKEMYQNNPDGLSGNEDCGQMSSWFVFSSLGFYPVCPGSTTYSLGRPLFENAKIQLENGKKFQIIYENNNESNKYIQSIFLNDIKYEQLFIEHDSIIKGGKLLIKMGNQANESLKNWKNELIEDPFFDSIIPLAFVDVENKLFVDSMVAKIQILPLKGLTAKYTLDGSEPDFSSLDYKQNIKLTSKTKLKIKSFRYGKPSYLPSVETEFTPLNNNWELNLKTEYANSYRASGDNALIDKERGGIDFRSGAWQGYEQVNCRGEITLKEAKSAQKIIFSCLQDQKSWIFFPKEIQVEVEYENGEKESLILKNTEPPLKDGARIKEFVLETKVDNKIKKISFDLFNISNCPKGHLSEGEKAWLFVDEIFIE
ncbi:MAG: glycoside hydrolase family 92 protein [Flavobacteriia bacterium]|nr:glycoside hydrolase family 92 protein [Flavobacteriia bacterium]